MPKKTYALIRTHMVTGSLLHNGHHYVEGDTITFGPDMTDEQIQTLIDMGELDGPIAERKRIERELSEAQSGIASMSREEKIALWRTFNRSGQSNLLAAEKGEARIKDDTIGARAANIEELDTDESVEQREHTTLAAQ